VRLARDTARNARPIRAVRCFNVARIIAAVPIPIESNYANPFIDLHGMFYRTDSELEYTYTRN